MSGVRDLLLWGFIILGTSLFFSEFGSWDNNPVVASLSPSQGYHKGAESCFYKASDGHFYIETRVNDTEDILFLLDTGATDIALNAEDAAKLGIDLNSVRYTKVYNTANGTIKSAPVNLEKMEIGDFMLTNVTASVSNAPLDVSLLGMSALERFRFTIEGNKLFLSAPSGNIDLS